MREEQYEKIRNYFLMHKNRMMILTVLYQFLPYFVAAIYFVMLFCLIRSRDSRILKVITVPGFVLLMGTMIRSQINARRPYEKQIIPLIAKDTKGKSFPSRHLLCAGVILACAIYLNQFVFLLLLLSILIGICRILAGVHSFSDVIAGFLIGLCSGLFLLFL